MVTPGWFEQPTCGLPVNGEAALRLCGRAGPLFQPAIYGQRTALQAADLREPGQDLALQPEGAHPRSGILQPPARSTGG